MDAWIANLSDGSTHQEEWLAGYLSPWQRLMDYCSKNYCYVTNLRLTMGRDTRSCVSGAKGYWQAHGVPATQGVECEEDIHTWKGIGWVAPYQDRGEESLKKFIGGDVVNVIWGARDPKMHKVVWWTEVRSAENQNQIIWSDRKEQLVLQLG
jgi:hypothetical protein